MTPSDLGTRLFDPQGALECADATDPWWVPEIVLAGDGVLIWRHGGAEHPGHQVHVGPKLLEDFVRLPAADDRAIEAYVRRWGVLYICEHNLISSHRHTPRATPQLGWWWRCDLHVIEVEGHYWYCEPLDVWRKYAEIARAMLAIAGDLYRDRPGEVNDWRVVLGLGNDDEPPTWALESPWHGRFFLRSVVNSWLDLARVRPTLWWTEKITTVTLGNRVLFDALAIQLLHVIGRRRGLAICSSCGRFYTPPRRPAANRRRYCDECRPRAAVRDASADYRDRQRQAKGPPDL